MKKKEKEKEGVKRHKSVKTYLLLSTQCGHTPVNCVRISVIFGSKFTSRIRLLSGHMNKLLPHVQSVS